MDPDYPVDEYWGISVKTENIKPSKKPWYKKALEFIFYILATIKEFFIRIFAKLKSKIK